MNDTLQAELDRALFDIKFLATRCEKLQHENTELRAAGDRMRSILEKYDVNLVNSAGAAYAVQLRDKATRKEQP